MYVHFSVNLYYYVNVCKGNVLEWISVCQCKAIKHLILRFFRSFVCTMLVKSIWKQKKTTWLVIKKYNNICSCGSYFTGFTVYGKNVDIDTVTYLHLLMFSHMYYNHNTELCLYWMDTLRGEGGGLKLSLYKTIYCSHKCK